MIKLIWLKIGISDTTARGGEPKQIRDSLPTELTMIINKWELILEQLEVFIC